MSGEWGCVWKVWHLLVGLPSRLIYATIYESSCKGLQVKCESTFCCLSLYAVQNEMVLFTAYIMCHSNTDVFLGCPLQAMPSWPLVGSWPQYGYTARSCGLLTCHCYMCFDWLPPCMLMLDVHAWSELWGRSYIFCLTLGQCIFIYLHWFIASGIIQH